MVKYNLKIADTLPPTATPAPYTCEGQPNAIGPDGLCYNQQGRKCCKSAGLSCVTVDKDWPSSARCKVTATPAPYTCEGQPNAIGPGDLCVNQHGRRCL